MKITGHFYDITGTDEYWQFEQRYDKQRVVHAFLNGIHCGLSIFTPDSNVCDFFSELKDYEDITFPEGIKVSIWLPYGAKEYDDVMVTIVADE